MIFFLKLILYRAWGIYLGASIVDHSCCPNANVIFEGRNIVIRALTDIPEHKCSRNDKKCELEGQLDMATNVRISYLDVMDHTLVRQKKLLDQYYFLCQCNRCLRKQFSWQPNQFEKNVTVSRYT